jgi:hypothetical protein
MIFAFVGLMPLGTLIVRLLGWSRIHGINQTFASILAIIGAAIGIYISTLYNRVSYSLEFLQAALTLYQEQEIQLWPSNLRSHGHNSNAHPTRPRHNAPSHLQANQTNHEDGTHSRLARPHRHHLRNSQRFPVSNFLSPTYPIPANTSHFSGFPLAISNNYDYILLGLVLLVATVTLPILIFLARRRAHKAREAREANNNGGESPKFFASEAFGTNIRMENMGNPAHYGRPVVEPWSRV